MPRSFLSHPPLLQQDHLHGPDIRADLQAIEIHPRAQRPPEMVPPIPADLDRARREGLIEKGGHEAPAHVEDPERYREMGLDYPKA